ncbi:MAG TPA: 2'-5' RNA ligase family protein [Actinomycetales bacterium]|nr:2'-5' RNA ligase family protein [Actinomycetales bacterium]
MTSVFGDITMSVDGFVTGPGTDLQHGLGLDADGLHAWALGSSGRCASLRPPSPSRTRSDVQGLDDAKHGSPATETALIVAVLEAEPVVGRHRRDLDRSAAWGVPPHVTILYPFLSPSEVDELVLTALSSAVRSVPAFDCAFPATRWFGDDVVWLEPSPGGPFRDLTEAVWRRFPEYPPYGGRYDDVVPHLTVAERELGSIDMLKAAESAVRAMLPVRARVHEALLIAGSSRPSSWRTVHVLPLG